MRQRAFVFLASFLAVLLLSLFAFPAYGTAAVCYVKTDGNDSNTGLSWDNAKKTIQAAIDELCEGVGEVWVKAGTYNPEFRKVCDKSSNKK